MSSTLDSTAFPSPTESALDSGGSEDDACNGNPNNSDTHFHLRIASIFIILVGSCFGTFFPIIARRSRFRDVIPKAAFDFAKFFGSGVIIATAFIHLLDPALEALGNPCLTGTWQVYPWALALCMFSIFLIFFAELIAFRWGTAKLKEMGITYDPHGHMAGGAHAAHGPEGGALESTRVADAPGEIIPTDAASRTSSKNDSEKRPSHARHGQSSGPGDDLASDSDHLHSHVVDPLKEAALPQIIGILVLEFGVVLHSVLIGLTLAVDPDFKVLFVVIVFHQMFEGLGLGSRLAYLTLPHKYNYVAYVAAAIYGITTPVGIAAGLGVRSTYNPDSAKASAVSGIMDALSAGVLVYTGLVELLAHEFLFSPEMSRASNGKLTYACGCMIFGAGCMSLLGRWA